MKLPISIPIPLLLLTTTTLIPTTTLSSPLLPLPLPLGSDPCPALPNNPSLPADPKLPDPFRFFDTDADATTKEDFLQCRQEQVRALFQRYELGELPPQPEVVTATFSGPGSGSNTGTLTINCAERGKQISFSVSISYPPGKQGPYPAIIAYGGLSIPLPTDGNIAVITFNNDDLAAQVNAGSRGQGKFYDLYGQNHTAGAMIAWAWGVSRILDALEMTAPQANINLDRVGVTGCSRNGKGALVAGAFDERIALTIPQESGSGGSACWRLSDAMWDSGQNVQTAREIVTENVWFSTSFNPYASTNVDVLPFDHHMLAGLVAPRGLFVVENTGYEWLGPMSCYGCMKTAQKVWTALGVEDHMGFSQVGNHLHCQFPASQEKDLFAFVDKFLLDRPANTTGVMYTDGTFEFDEAQWIDWTVPKLQ
ncbi:Glucuronoyl esterase catalytic domain from Hypocrea Jecorina [Thermoascus aurantiacus ATCC 26904]